MKALRKGPAEGGHSCPPNRGLDWFGKLTTSIPLSAVIAVWLLLAPTAAGGERELWSLWQKHLASPGDHAVVVAACQAYAAALPDDPFLPVVHGIEAWHLLASDQTADGVRKLTPYLDAGDGALDRGAQRLARAWITRLQRGRVVDALQAYYRAEVRYPAELSALPAGNAVPRVDAWGKPWRYRLTGFDGVPGYRDQKYKLESVSIQPPYDPAAALAVPYAEQIVAQASPVPRSPPGVTLVKLETSDPDGARDAVVGQVGNTVGEFYIAHAGRNLVIVCDTLHWKVLTWTP